MALFFTLLPVYLFGNLHCLGMCGPLVMMIGQNRFSLFYYLGRMISYSLTGFLAGALGLVLQISGKAINLGAYTSLFFGFGFLTVGFLILAKISFPGSHFFAKKLANMSKNISLLLLRDLPWPTFLFGFFTVLLPCGQTVIVFSACALYGSPIIGFLNGAIFALFTSPGLFAAMKAYKFVQKGGKNYNVILGATCLIIGLLSCLRGLADLEMISHFVLNPESSSYYHLVLF